MKRLRPWLVGLSVTLGMAVACGDDESDGNGPGSGGEGGGTAGGEGGAAGSDVTPGSGSGGEAGQPSPAGGEAGATTAGGGGQAGDGAGATSTGGTDGGSATTGGTLSGGEAGGTECPTGSEACPCYPNDTCDADLTCLSGVCVDAGQGGAGGAGATGGSGGSSDAGAGGEGGEGGEGEPPIGSLTWENGWFFGNTTGWNVTGGDVEISDAPTTGNFRLFGMRQLTTFTDAGDANEVTISQRFDVPDNALALRFVVWGGSESVQLLDADGEEIESVTGPESDLNPICVSWDLDMLQGERVEFRITDDSSSAWGYVTISGIDLIRDVPSPIVNHEFRDGGTNWFPASEHFTYYFDMLTNRYSFSTFASTGPSLGVALIGEIEQSFALPSDALALRFWVHGGAGSGVNIYLREDAVTTVAGPAKGAGSDEQLIPVSWDLTPYRDDPNMMILLVDSDAAEYIAMTGFDVITSTNGQ